MRYGHFKIGIWNQKAMYKSMASVTKTFWPKFALRKKICSNNFFFQFYILNIARVFILTLKKLEVTDLDFPEKHKKYPKIVIFVLLQARNVTMQYRQCDLPLRSMHTCTKNTPHASACALYAVYRFERLMSKPP